MRERGAGVRAVLAFDVEIRKIICTTNAIESVNARIRRAVKARGHFPNEAAALKCVYMAIMSLDLNRHRATTLVDVLEACPQRLRHRLLLWAPGSQAASRPNQHQLHRLVDRPQRRGGARVFTHASSGWPIEAPTT